MWTCPVCGSSFRNRSQTHSCGAASVADHLANASPVVAATEGELPIVHRFELHRPDEVDAHFVRWLRLAFQRGMKY